MTTRGVLLISFVMPFVLVRGDVDCMSPTEFSKKNDEINRSQNKDYSTTNYHEYLFQKAKKFSSGRTSNFDRKSDFLGSSQIKKVTFDDEKKKKQNMR